MLKIIKYRTKIYFKSCPEKAFINVFSRLIDAKLWAEIWSKKTTVHQVELEEC